MEQQINSVLDFWFKELTPEQWYVKDIALDNTIRVRFAALHQQARNNELYQWRQSAHGALAEIIILDQFSRNMFRDNSGAFSQDPQALALAQLAIDKKFDEQLSTQECAFLYMPFMHSESLAIHKVALDLFAKPGLESGLDYGKQHMAIIARFGRYPHRNEVLGRISSEEEVAFLQQPNSSF